MSIPAQDYCQIAAAAEQVQAWQNPLGSKNPRSGYGGNGIIVDGYNNTGNAIDVFDPVELVKPVLLIEDEDGAVSDNAKHFAFEIKPANENTGSFGIMRDIAAAKETAPLMISGITVAKIYVNDADHKYVKVNSAGKLETSESGSVRILWKADGTGSGKWGIILIGGSGGSDYNGQFKVSRADNNTLSVSGGYLNRNGDFSKVEAKTEITPKTGKLCIYSTIKDSKWTDPEYKIIEPAADAYPIAEITVDKENNVSIKQYPVTVAVILLVKVCPLTKKK
ncbi:MAG: hypothetical protein PHV59_12685 [Victivallales bacterium]|nr:hypothetical protein [Victivallales bacterium]